MSGQTPKNSEAGPQVESASPDTPLDPFLEIITEWYALREFAGHYAAAMKDRAGDQLRSWSRGALAALLWTCILIALVVSCVVLAVLGVDAAFCALFGRLWLGHLATGVGGLLILFGVLRFKWSVSDQIAQERRTRDYEQRKARQHELLGRDVDTTAE